MQDGGKTSTAIWDGEMGRTQSRENKLIAGEMQMPQCMCGTITLDRIKGTN